MRRCFGQISSTLLITSLSVFAQISPSETSAASAPSSFATESGVVQGANTSGFQLLTAGVEPGPGLYLGAILTRVRSNWYPRITDLQISSGWKQGATVIDLEIKKKDGSLGKTTTIASAGDPALDQAAVDAIASSAPLGPVPEVYRGKALRLRMHFGYNQPASVEAPMCDDRNHPEREKVRYQAGQGIKPPKPAYQPEPEFSEEARKAKYQGNVTLAGTIDPRGEFTDLCVVQALGAGLDEKAIEAVRTWRFEPATRQGQPVAVRIAVEVTFRMY